MSEARDTVEYLLKIVPNRISNGIVEQLYPCTHNYIASVVWPQLFCVYNGL